MIIVDKPMRKSSTLVQLYRTINGLCYNVLTPDEVIMVLEEARTQSTRIKIFYGYTQHEPFGCEWLRDDYVTEGYICRSDDDRISVPLMIQTKNAKDGFFVHSESIVKIISIKNESVLYQHPTYHHPRIEIRKVSLQQYPDASHGVYVEGQLRSHFIKHRFAEFWCSNRHLTVSYDEGE